MILTNGIELAGAGGQHEQRRSSCLDVVLDQVVLVVLGSVHDHHGVCVQPVSDDAEETVEGDGVVALRDPGGEKKSIYVTLSWERSS